MKGWVEEEIFEDEDEERRVSLGMCWQMIIL